MAQIVDQEKKKLVIAICNKLKDNGYIKKYEVEESSCRIYLWIDHFDVDDDKLIELFQAKHISARKPYVARTGYSIIVEIGKETEISLEECFDI